MRKITLIAICVLLFTSNCFAESVRKTPVVRAVEKCASMVVNIGTEQKVLLGQHPIWGQVYGNQIDAFHNNFFKNSAPVAVGTMKVESLGSGIIISEDGLIATNSHVISMANKIFVTMPDGQTKEAILIGTDHANDIALIQVHSPKPIPYMEFTPDVWVGETVISIGSPLGLQNSVSAGIVSGTKRTFYTKPQVESLKDLIQTDASINQGSSGGALINLEGQLVGMNVATIQEAQGMSFAIPSHKIKTMLDEYNKVRTDKK